MPEPTTPNGPEAKGEKASISYRQLFNEYGGDSVKAAEEFRRIALAGGYGDVDLDQTLDLSSAHRAVEENKPPEKEDLFAKKQREARGQDSGKVLTDLKAAMKGDKKG